MREKQILAIFFGNPKTKVRVTTYFNLERNAIHCFLASTCQLRHFQSRQRYFPRRFLLFFFTLIVNNFPKLFCEAFTCSKQNNRENIVKTVSLFVAMTAVLKACSSLGVFKSTRTLLFALVSSFFLFVNSSC